MTATKRRQQITRELALLQGGKCYYCHDELHFDSPRCPDRATFDHIEVASAGGELSAQNGVAACSTCNSLRGTIHWVKWMSFIRNDMFQDCIRNVKRHRHASLKEVTELDKKLKATTDRLESLKQRRKETVEPTKKAVRKYTKRFLKAVA